MALQTNFYVKCSHVWSNLDTLHEKGRVKGQYVGFNALNDKYSVKLGCTTYILGIPGHGKCLGKGTKIIMADGTLKEVQNIITGDKIMGVNGFRTVLNTITGYSKMYLIKQNHGINYRVNDAHILSLKRKTTHKKQERGSVLNISVTDYLKMGKAYQKIFKGYKKSCAFPKQKLNIEPYFIGLWLGDGRQDDISIANIDSEIIEYLSDYAKRTDGKLSIYKSKSRCNSYAIVKTGLKKKLRNLNLLNNKHIPLEYLSNSKKNRLQLLAGLIDSDGCLNTTKNNYEVTFKNERLARDLKYLCDTLGFRTSINSKIARIKSIDYECIVWRVIFGGEIHKIPCRIKRKKLKEKKRYLFTGIEITEEGYDAYYGFTLDGDGLFLLEDGTVTHNSEFLFEILINLSEFYGWRHIIYSPETGTATDIFLELAIKYCKKPLKKITKDEFHKATAFLDEYFYVLNPQDNERTPDKLFQLALNVKKEHHMDDKHFHTFSIDPWNELSHDFTAYNGREDKYLAYMLGHIRQKSKDNGIHTFIVAHPRTLREKRNDNSYAPPTTYEFSGGAEWFNKAETILCIYRPKIYDSDTKEHFNNVRIIIQKAKPKGIGCNKGDIELFYDTENSRYYEEINGNKLFANKNQLIDEIPF